MKIAVGSDHAGYEEPAPYYKPELVKYLKSLGHEVIDCGAFGPESVDYPDFGQTVAEAVSRGECDKRIVICGTGVGISIAANKVKGIRAALCTDTYMARMTREHNDANILALGERVLGVGVALDIVETWLGTQFVGGRHQQRIEKIAQIEEKYNNEI